MTAGDPFYAVSPDEPEIIDSLGDPFTAAAFKERYTVDCLHRSTVGYWNAWVINDNHMKRHMNILNMPGRTLNEIVRDLESNNGRITCLRGEYIWRPGLYPRYPG